VRALVADGLGGLRVGEAPELEPGPGQLAVRVAWAGVCGSDLHALGSASEGQVLGHEFSGVVAAVGPGVDDFAPGDRVVAVPAIGCGACRACVCGDPMQCRQRQVVGFDLSGGFAEVVLVGAVWALRVPDVISLRRAAIAEPLAVGLKIVERAPVSVGGRVAVLGGGPIGLAVTWWAATLSLARILVSDPVLERRRRAEDLGAELMCDPQQDDPRSVMRAAWGARPDVVHECAGRPGTLATAFDLVAAHGTVALAGLHDQPETFSRVPPLLKEVSVAFPNFTTRDGFAGACRLLEQRGDLAEVFITHEVPLAEMPAFLPRMQAPNAFGKVLVAVGDDLA